MEERQARSLRSYRRILELVRNTRLEPTPPLLLRMSTDLERSLKRIGELSAGQYASRSNPQVQAARVRQMRHELRRGRMLPLVRIAKPLVKFAPGTAAVLKVPHARTDSVTLAAHAQALAKALAPHNRLLVSAGYPKDILATLRAEAAALATAARAAEHSREQLSRTTAQLKREFRKASDTVSVIEGILMPRFLNDHLLEHTWRNARRIGGKVGRPRKRRSEMQTLPVT